MNPVLKEILDKGIVLDSKGRPRTLHDHITADGGKLIQDLVIKFKPNIIVEVGCAFGISSLYIAEALKEVGGTRHVILDPFQNDPDQWDGIGIRHLKTAGYWDNIDFHEIGSEIGLPRLLTEGLKDGSTGVFWFISTL